MDLSLSRMRSSAKKSPGHRCPAARTKIRANEPENYNKTKDLPKKRDPKSAPKRPSNHPRKPGFHPKRTTHETARIRFRLTPITICNILISDCNMTLGEKLRYLREVEGTLR